VAPLFATRLLAVNHWILWVCCAGLCAAAALALVALASSIRARSRAAQVLVSPGAKPLTAAD
jgi:hypothetical protein